MIIIILTRMPTVLFIFEWGLYFYANENKEPIHIHAEKGDMECNYWLFVNEMDIKEEYYKYLPFHVKLFWCNKIFLRNSCYNSCVVINIYNAIAARDYIISTRAAI